jgi:DNA-binding CsgD family transcriptional regulator
MSEKVRLILLLLLHQTYFLTASDYSEGWQLLEEKVQSYNDEREYVRSLQIIDEYITQGEKDPYDLYSAYLLKSYTYKRLFNYEDVFLNLELALKAGLKSKHPLEAEARVKAEKAFAYFDIHQYFQANELMQQLRKTGYQYLTGEQRSFLVMQQGYLEMLNFNYPTSESLFKEALALMEKHGPRNTPMVYGKLLELYGKTGNKAAMMNAFQQGMDAARHFKILKYEMYMFEMLRNQYVAQKDYESAFHAFEQLDSLSNEYDATNNLNQLKAYEKEYAVLEKEMALNKQKSTRNLLIIVLLFTAALAITLFRLYKSRKHEMELLEKEYERIRLDLEQLTLQLNVAQKDKPDLKDMNLTPRQLEIIELIKKGYSNKQIGSELYISENTVKYHLKAIYDLLQVDNRTQLFHLYQSERNENA